MSSINDVTAVVLGNAAQLWVGVCGSMWFITEHKSVNLICMCNQMIGFFFTEYIVGASASGYASVCVCVCLSADD